MALEELAVDDETARKIRGIVDIITTPDGWLGPCPASRRRPWDWPRFVAGFWFLFGREPMDSERIEAEQTYLDLTGGSHGGN